MNFDLGHLEGGIGEGSAFQKSRMYGQNMKEATQTRCLGLWWVTIYRLFCLSGCFVYGVERLVVIRLEKVLKIGFCLFFRCKGDIRGGWG